jgi:hypothetical protein
LSPLIIDLFTLQLFNDRGVGVGAVSMRVGIAVLASIALCGDAIAAPAQYAVDGLAIGTQLSFNSASYREYKCSPSEQFGGLTWCQKVRSDKERRGSYTAAYSLLHAKDGNLLYVNRSQQPAFFSSNEADEDIQRYSRKIGETPRIMKMPHRSNLPDGIIAIWGQITLVQLDEESVKILSDGKSPKKGLLIDFLGNFVRSAKEGLPIYRIDGGAGFVWAASFDQKGRGTLRMAAVDASGFASPPPPEPQAKSEPTGDRDAADSTGPEARQTSSGLEARQPSSGLEARQASSGPEARQTSSGLEARQTSSGPEARQTSSGLEVRQTIEKLQTELAVAAATIADLEKAKAVAEGAYKEAAKARLDAETARSEIEQAAVAEKTRLEKTVARLEANGTTAYAKNNRWENALYGSIGGLLVILTASSVGFFMKRQMAWSFGTNPIDVSAQSQNSNAEIEPYALSPAIAIAEDAFGRELEEQVAAINATQGEADRNDAPQVETNAGGEERSNEIGKDLATA